MSTSSGRRPDPRRFPADACWPTDAQTSLLQAALLEGPRARQALDTWRGQVALDTLDRGSSRLLPLLWLNPGLISPDDPLRPRLEAAYTKAAADTEALIDAVAPALGALHAAGIETMVLKGVALAVECYPAIGARPMDDCDMVVKPADVREACRVLQREGWQLDGPLDDDVIAVSAEVGFVSGSGHCLDLHWHVQRECADAASDAEFWAKSRPLVVAGQPTRRLDIADQLIHVCVHGLRWSTVPPVRWVSDAMMMFRAAGSEVNWDALVERTARRGFGLPIADAMRFLRDQLDAPVPDDVLKRLDRIPSSFGERLEYRVKMRRRTPARLAVVHWFQLRRLRGRGGVIGDLVRFPRYFARLWGVRSLAEVGKLMIQKARRRHVVARGGSEG